MHPNFKTLTFPLRVMMATQEKQCCRVAENLLLTANYKVINPWRHPDVCGVEWSAAGGGAAVSAFNLHLLHISTSASGALRSAQLGECKTPQEQNDVVIYIKACIRSLNKQTLTMYPRWRWVFGLSWVSWGWRSCEVEVETLNTIR